MADPANESDLTERLREARRRSAELTSHLSQNAARSKELVERLTGDLAEARAKIANLEIALESNRRIAIAVGIVMSKHAVNEDTAFAVLQKLSQTRHEKLRVVADRIVYTGEIPAA